jgi:hypothetical protein
MPLYIDDTEIESRFCVPVALALKAIKSHMQGRAVTPSLALSLMKKYFQPLIPECHQDVLGNLTQASWEDLEFTYAEMVFRSGQPSGQLSEIAVSINLICIFTTHPPRVFPDHETIEITYFLQICRQLKLGIEDSVRYSDNGRFDVLRACKYCWRQPVPGRFICSTHTAGDKHVTIKLGDQEDSNVTLSFTDYKESRRQKKAFDKTLNQILTKEVLEFHDSQFTAPILMADKYIWQWLSDRRPLLSELLLDQNKTKDDDHIVGNLLSLLHSPIGLTEIQHRPYLKTNTLIKAYPILIWPMLLRAEAWLTTRKKLRDNWGGKRNNLLEDQ